ncbi:Lrp/AsnC family transcriptional regulator [Ruegeria sp. TM1040]|jgi:DNA-binding Lrp family transcriptional regulator|uniref:Lrp/AsnC family transcriptional regulator n=1 Tax=Rhodobacterales TaxID=204455 RepID=UPI0000462AF3|nr:Lrp/AsnC family transcriptional regulator [Ruegeria sp. TM1040]ABF62646.1 transcriptional regulator, AsnC family [Ruegeria sp. TM1040]
MRLDDRDRRILTLLQEDSRMSNADLAESVGMSASALWRRVRSLEEAGVIKRYGAVVVPQAMGLNFEALVQVNLTRHAPEHLQEFIRAVEGNPHVVECYATTGQADYHLRILAPDLEAYNQFLEQFLFQLAGVASAQTHVILKTVKRDTPVVP